MAPEDLKGEFFEGEVFPLGSPILWQGGYLFWNEKTAIRSEAFENNLFEGELLSFQPWPNWRDIGFLLWYQA